LNSVFKTLDKDLMFPSDILAEIFKFLKWDDRLRFMRVNRTCLNIVYKHATTGMDFPYPYMNVWHAARTVNWYCRKFVCI